MKSFILKSLVLSLTLLVSISSFAQDSVIDQHRSKLVQEAISKEINRISSIDIQKVELNDYIESEEAKCLSNAKNNNEAKDLCFDNTQRMIEIGDLETIIDLDIAKLTEYQTSIYFTAITVTLGTFDSSAWFLLLPVALVLDIPASIFILLTGGL